MLEQIDVLTPDGMPAGIVKPKPDVHRDGDWHRCAHVWIVASDGRVLLQRRALAKENWPGLWDISVAGHVSAGESAMDAAIRETHEEIGLLIAPEDLIHIGTLRYSTRLRDDYVENEFHEVHIVRRDVDLSTLTLDPAEVAEVRYVGLDELERYDRVPHEEEYALLSTTIRAAARP
ncbi:MAG TPA: NUDIX domain-containing protein [Thermoanaerobaculia bacterium]